jgi:phenylalanine ammonia-lyase
MSVSTPATAMVWLDGDSLRVEDVVAVARDGAEARLAPAAYERIGKSHDLNRDLVAGGAPIYGVTTGFGDSVGRRIDPGHAGELQAHLLDFLGCGTGPTLDAAAARAVTLARANCLAKGCSAVRPVVVERLCDVLNAGAAPVIPEQGSIGASGDLVPSSYVAAVLTGRRTLLVEGEPIPAERFWRSRGVEPLALEAKEGLALVNGTAFMVGVGCLAVADARRLARIADLCTALTVETLLGIDSPFNAFVHAVKPHPGQARSAEAIRGFLSGSELVRAYADVAASPTAEPIQDKYSIRCAPQCIGALYDTIDWVERWLLTELNSANDNPLYDVDGGAVHSAGNFSGFHVALAMDALKTAVASVVDLLDRQMELLVDEKFNNGLTPNLVGRVPEGSPLAGLDHGFKGMQIAMSALAAEALNRTMPMTSFSRSAECHNQDKVSMGATAARQARDVLEIAERAAATHLLAACQAAHLRGPDMLGGTRPAYEAVRAVSAPLEHDRPMDVDVMAVTNLLRRGML